MSVPIPPHRLTAPFLVVLDACSPPANAAAVVEEISDFLVANGAGCLLKQEHNFVCPNAPIDEDAVHQGFTGGAASKVVALGASIKEEPGASSPAPAFFFDPRCEGAIAEHATHRARRIMLYNAVKPAFKNQAHLIKDLCKGDFFSLIQVLKLQDASNPRDDVCNAIIKMVQMVVPLPLVVDFGATARGIKEVQQVLASPREGNCVVGDDIPTLFFLKSLEGDSRYVAHLEIFRQRTPALSLADTVAHFTAVTTRLPVAPSSSPLPDPLAFQAFVSDRQGGCHSMKRHGRCLKGPSCPWNHDPVVVANTSLPADRSGGGATCLFCRSTEHDVSVCTKYADFKTALSQSASHKGAPVVARMAMVPGAPVEVGIDFELQDMLANYEVQKF
jgi:hypothetical protein